MIRVAATEDALIMKRCAEAAYEHYTIRIGKPPAPVIANHMAVTFEALQRSILRPRNSGAVYPESFEVAFPEWNQKAVKGEGSICTKIEHPRYSRDGEDYAARDTGVRRHMGR